MRGKQECMVFDKKNYRVEEIGSVIIIRRKQLRNGKKNEKK
jgi:hypothetical protein